MPRYAQLVMGPAGSGKSTYCSVIQKHAEICKRNVRVVNLDPAAEFFDYDVAADIRDLISLEDAMDDDDLKFGPNGGLVFCMEYFAQNFEWVESELGDYDDDYFLFDCPGQIELYTHIPVMRNLVNFLQNKDFRVCGVFLLDSHFLVDTAKYFSGSLAALSAMVTLEIPHINVMSKVDLLDKAARKNMKRFLDPDAFSLLDDDDDEDEDVAGFQVSRSTGVSSSAGPSHSTSSSSTPHPLKRRFRQLTNALARVVDDFSLVRFVPLNISDENSIEEVFYSVNSAIQYGEDHDVREMPEDIDDDDDVDSGMPDDDRDHYRDL